MRQTVFYSWQSDLPNRTNRGFIGDCLERALRELNAGETSADGLDVDRDTLNEQGAPEIAATILKKINRCAVFVADVSIINSSSPARKTPNPNVLIELGWAAGSRGWERLLCVANTAFGPIDQLPFDIRHRRVVAYSLPEADEKAAVRGHLVGMLRDRIGEILAGSVPRLARELQAFLEDVAPQVMVAVRQGVRTLTVDVPASQSQVLQTLAADPAFATLATFRENGNYQWNDSRGPRNGYVATLTDEFARYAR